MSFEAAYNYSKVDLGTAAALFVLGLLRTDDLAPVGKALLARGHDGQALRALANCADDGPDNARLFLRTLDELDVPLPRAHAAAMKYARWICSLIVADELAPYEGAKVIWEAVNRVRNDRLPFDALDAFVYAASEYEDRAADRPAFAVAIKEEAVALLRHVE